MNKKLLTKIYILILLLISFTTYSFAVEDPTTQIIDEFEYTLVDELFVDSTLEEINKLDESQWHAFESIEVLSEKVDNSQIVWFRARLPETIHHNMGLFFDDFRASSIKVFIGSEVEYIKNRNWGNNHNSFLILLKHKNNDTNIFIKADIAIPNIGPTTGISMGDYDYLEQVFLSTNIINLYIGFIIIITATFILFYLLLTWGHNTRASISLFIISTTMSIMFLYYSPALHSIYPKFDKIGLTVLECSMYLGAASLVYFLYLLIGQTYTNSSLKKITALFNSIAIAASLLLITNHFYNILSYEQYFFITSKFIGLFLIISIAIIIFYSIRIRTSNSNLSLFRVGILILCIVIAVELALSMLSNYTYTPVLWKSAFIFFLYVLVIIVIKLFTYKKREGCETHQTTNR